MAVKWHNTCKLSFSKSRLNREKAKASTAGDTETEEMDIYNVSTIVQWIKKERDERKPLCLFIRKVV